MQASDPLDPRAVLGAVKARPGKRRSRKPSATAGLDRSLRATRSTFCGPGRRNGPLARTKELRGMRSKR
jgi:hypothetical protein